MVSSTLLLVAHLAAAQTGSEFTPPPMVPVPPSTAPVAPPPPPPDAPPTPPGVSPPGDAPTTANPGTPPPPSLTPGPSPYGQPKPPSDEKPPVEYGLMISEGLFGALTAAGVSLLPYFLLFREFLAGDNPGIFGDRTVSTVLYLILFAAIPLSTAQTEVSIANGSRWYYSDTWPAALVGLGTEAAVLGLAYLTKPNERQEGLTVVQTPNSIANPWVLLIGTIGVLPLAQMAIINLLKTPRFGKPGSAGFALLNVREQGGVTVGVPNMAPVFSADRGSGGMTGVQFSILSGRW